MPRQPRIEYPGACYHVMARGDRREAIFEDDVDREIFLKTLGEVAERSGWRIYAWVLMNNHYHWAIETPEANLVAGMKWFQNTFTRRINSRHRKWGHLFGGRYKAIPVQNEDLSGGTGDYLCNLIDYIHLNPARAGLVGLGTESCLLDYRWSSLSQGYNLSEASRKPWMAVKEGLAFFGFADSPAERKRFIKRLSERIEAGTPSPSGVLLAKQEEPPHASEGGWYLGSEGFRDFLISKREAGLMENRNYRSSPIGKEQERRKAEEWLRAGAQHFSVTIPPEGSKHYRERVAIAWALHRKTNQSQSWIAEMLGLHSAANVSQQVRRFQKEIEDPSVSSSLSKMVLRWIYAVERAG